MSGHVGRIQTVEVPQRMRSLPRDRRGYPIPYVVFRDGAGAPHFTINDIRRSRDCRVKLLCAICGQPHRDGFWFVGGSRCFIHENGAFVDPPLHRECAEYALQVCPFLAAPSYSKRIDAKTLRPDGQPMLLMETEGMDPNQPVLFGLGHARRYRTNLDRREHRRPIAVEPLFLVDQWTFVEWWHDGIVQPAPTSTQMLTWSMGL